MTSFSLRGKTALLTGSTGFFGTYFAKALEEAGVARLILIDRDAERLRRQKADLEGICRTMIIALDLYDRKAADEMLTRIGATEAVDILINNAFDFSVRTGAKPGGVSTLKVSCRSSALNTGTETELQHVKPKAETYPFMHKRTNKRILVMVSDLFFTVKIGDAARRVGMQVDFVKEEKDFLEKAQSKPALIIIDLNVTGANPVKVVSKLKGDPDLKSISVLAYVSHVQGELKQKAHESGCDMVVRAEVPQ